jgi:hypothetical protein
MIDREIDMEYFPVRPGDKERSFDRYMSYKFFLTLVKMKIVTRSNGRNNES